MKNIVLVCGPPFSGKGTQSIKIAENMGYIHISSGDLLRGEKRNNSEISGKILEYEKKGQLLPDEIAIPFIESKLLDLLKDHNLVLDGYPRNLEQLTSFESFIRNNRFHILGVFSFVIQEKTLIQRAAKRASQTNRIDDRSYHLHKKRISEFHSVTKPILKRLEQLDNFHIIDADRSINTIFEEIQLRLEDAE